MWIPEVFSQLLQENNTEMYCEDGGQLQLQISPLFCKQNHSTDGSCGNLNHCIVFSSPTYIITIKPDPA